MEDDTWTGRDLPVLKAAVELYDKTGHVRADAIERAVGFDPETVQQAIRALYTEPYFQPSDATSWGGRRILLGDPTNDAYRVAGKWPTPENLLERLVAALEAASNDDDIPEPERSKAKQAALWLGDALSKIAIGALGGAGGHALYS
jgi:hypothetical protein